MAADTGLWHLLVPASASSQWIEIGISATVVFLFLISVIQNQTHKFSGITGDSLEKLHTHLPQCIALLGQRSAYLECFVRSSCNRLKRDCGRGYY